MNSTMWIATAIFVLAYAVIISEKIHRTIIALSGAVLMIVLGLINQEAAVEAIDFNTIGLLTGMMIVVGITKRTGLFEYMAFQAARAAKGEPIRILVYLSLITAVASAFLDNVTTVLLIVPVTLFITKTLNVNPIPFLFSQIIASNIGGTATLIGDPPNIMIGSQVGLSFMDFIINLTPVIVIIMIVTVLLFKVMYKKELEIPAEMKQKILSFNPADSIKDHALLRKCLFVLAIVIIGFFLHGALHMESATIALFGAALLLLLSRANPEEVLHEVEWPTLFFFIGLFVMVGTLEHLGVIELMAKGVLSITGDNLIFTTLLILWVSAIASAIIDNIPFVATMIPLIQSMGQLGGIDVGPLWWALALGACLGGNGTLIGASANVVVAGIAERNGYPITFMRFTKTGFPLMLVSIVISTIYVFLMYLR